MTDSTQDSGLVPTRAVAKSKPQVSATGPASDPVARVLIGMRRRSHFVITAAVLSLVVAGVVLLALVIVLFVERSSAADHADATWQFVLLRLGPRTLLVVVAIYFAHLMATVFRFANRVALHLDATADALELSRGQTAAEFVAYSGALTPKYLDYDPLPPTPLGESAKEAKALLGVAAGKE